MQPTSKAEGLASEPRRRAFLFRHQQALPIAIAGFLMVLAIAAPKLAPYDPNALSVETVLASPSFSHPAGTDDLGRDVLSRVADGAQLSVVLAVTAGAVTAVISTLLALLGGAIGRYAEAAVIWILDGFMAFPALVLGLAVVALLGFSVSNVILAIVVIEVPRSTRVVRAAVKGIAAEPYVEAARATGAFTPRILFLHILPQVLPIILTLFAIDVGAAVMIEASMSFLGLGVQPPDASLGNLLSDITLTQAKVAPWLLIVPGMVIFVIILAFNQASDAVSSLLDPKAHVRT